MSDQLPNVQFGDKEAAGDDWRKADLPEAPDDDEELAETPEDVVFMLGFDPKGAGDDDGEAEPPANPQAA